eukprot:7030879-Ditylum_brightwellii.AAC.1
MVQVYDAGVSRLTLLISGSKVAKYALKKREVLKSPPPLVVPFVEDGGMEEDDTHEPRHKTGVPSPPTTKQQ